MTSKTRFTGNVPDAPEGGKPKPTSVRFETSRGARLVRVAAALVDESLNAFITGAAEARAETICREHGIPEVAA